MSIDWNVGATLVVVHRDGDAALFSGTLREAVEEWRSLDAEDRSRATLKTIGEIELRRTRSRYTIMGDAIAELAAELAGTPALDG